MRRTERLAWAATHVGRVRPLNEDRCLVGDWRSEQAIDIWRGSLPASRSWAVVADGMGGHEAGNVASRIVVDTIADLIRDADNETEIREMLAAVNRRLFEAMYGLGGKPGMGTTVVGIVLSGRELLVFNVGDSRAYAIRKGVLIQLSRDDTFDARSGRSRTRSHALTQSLGGTSKLQSVYPHVKCLAVDGNDALLLCSDGLTDMIDEDEITGILMRHPDNPAEKLVEAALDAGGEDNVTVVIIGSEVQPSRV